MKLPLQPVLILAILLVIAVSGCITDDPSILMKANPLVSQFLENHPNAEIRVVHYTPTEAEAILDDLMEDCQKRNMSAKEYYKITVEDVGDEFFVTAWIDWENKLIECAIKKGGEPENESTCKSHYKVRCYGEHVYWYDSCGSKEEKKEYCQNGCGEGKCIGIRTCEDMGGYCTYPLATTVSETSGSATTNTGAATGMVYGTDTSAITGGGESCERYYTCPGGERVKYCELITEREPVTCTESNAGKVCSAANISTKCICKENPEYLCTNVTSVSYCTEGYMEAGYWCPEKGVCCVPETSQCRSHNTYRCYGEHVYWYDFCGNKEDKKEYCYQGCENGICINQTNCTSQHEAKCYGGHVYWYNSCGNKETKKEYCNYGCENGACIQNQTNCTSQHEYRCYSGHVYWYDSCGSKGEKKENCTYGCENGTCITQNETANCTDSDGGLDYFTDGDINVTDVGILTISDMCLSDLVDLAVEYTTYQTILDNMVSAGIIEAAQLNDTNVLIESYCPPEIPANYTPFDFQTAYTCSNGCEGTQGTGPAATTGACIPES